MRGVDRPEKKTAIALLQRGRTPLSVAKELNLPHSTVLSWVVEAREQKKVSEAEIKVIIKNMATVLSVSEARIMAAASKVTDPRITDDEWFEFQAILTKELQNIVVLVTTGKNIDNNSDK